MHKVDSAGATAQNEFTNGDLPNGVARTRLEAKWMNSVQRELLALPVQAGKSLSDADDTQLVQSITLHVENVAALRALPIPAIPNTQTVMVFIRGAAVAGDGTAALYFWNYNSTTADNGVTVVRPASNPALGRWIRCGFDYATQADVLAALLGSTAQSWQNVSVSRALNTTYTNSTSRPIAVRFVASIFGNSGWHFVINGVDIDGPGAATDQTQFADTVIVPSGYTYRVQFSGSVASWSWSELR